MRRPCLRRKALTLAVGFAACFSASAALADASKVIATCSPAKAVSGGAMVSCDVRANGKGEFSALKVKVKGGKDLDVKFTPWADRDAGTSMSFMIQLLEPSQRRTLAQMADAVVAITDQRKAKRRFSAYSFSNELSLLADSGASKEEFARQVIAVKPSSTSTELYKSALRAIESLAKEPGERKSLVILADGATADMGYTHDQVVKAAKDGGIAIHVLGYYDAKSDQVKFQTLERLAEDTGGSAIQVKEAGKAADTNLTTSRYLDEVLLNGGTADITLKDVQGPASLEFVADFADGRRATGEATVDVPKDQAPPSIVIPPTPFSDTERPAVPSTGIVTRLFDWLADHTIAVVGLGALIGAGLIALTRKKLAGQGPHQASDEPAAQEDLSPVYGWLESLDGDRRRHALRTTNVRVGRHRDNDICIPNDSISRRHAIVHFNPETRRFIITDLGGGNGVVVNSEKVAKHELADGDIIELGDAKLRFNTAAD